MPSLSLYHCNLFCSQLYTVPTVIKCVQLYTVPLFQGARLCPLSPAPLLCRTMDKATFRGILPLYLHMFRYSPFPPVSAAALLLDRQETNGVLGCALTQRFAFVFHPCGKWPSLPTPAWTEPGWCVSPSTNTLCWLGANLPPR